MPTRYIPTGSFLPFDMNTPECDYILREKALLTGVNVTAITEGAWGSTLTILGDIKLTGVSTGLELAGTGTEVVIGKNAVISAGVGAVKLSGANQSLDNAGFLKSILSTVEATGAGFDISNTGRIHSVSEAGVSLTGEGAFTNNGRIEGSRGIEWLDAEATLFLGRNSAIDTAYAGVVRSNLEGQSTTVNQGSINAEYAFLGYLGDDTLINKGKIAGLIQFDAGDDTFDNTRGKFSGRVEGGEGDDTYIINAAGTKVIEAIGEGNDTMRSSASYALNRAGEVETLILTGSKDLRASGDDSANTITGNKGDNRLTGFGGDDILTGAAGKDIFVMRTAFDADTIADFRNGTDRIDVTQWAGIDDLADILANVTQQETGVLITVGSDSLLIADILIQDLDKKDFIF